MMRVTKRFFWSDWKRESYSQVEWYYWFDTLEELKILLLQLYRARGTRAINNLSPNQRRFQLQRIPTGVNNDECILQKVVGLSPRYFKHEVFIRFH